MGAILRRLAITVLPDSGEMGDMNIIGYNTTILISCVAAHYLDSPVDAAVASLLHYLGATCMGEEQSVVARLARQ